MPRHARPAGLRAAIRWAYLARMHRASARMMHGDRDHPDPASISRTHRIGPRCRRHPVRKYGRASRRLLGPHQVVEVPTRQACLEATNPVRTPGARPHEGSLPAASGPSTKTSRTRLPRRSGSSNRWSTILGVSPTRYNSTWRSRHADQSFTESRRRRCQYGKGDPGGRPRPWCRDSAPSGRCTPPGRVRRRPRPPSDRRRTPPPP